MTLPDDEHTTDGDEGRTFEAIARADGLIGVRNRVLVLPTVICSREVATRIAAQVPGAIAAPHDLGCGQIGADAEQTHRALIGASTSPNVAGVVVVGLGCEQAQSDGVATKIKDRGVPVKTTVIQRAGGIDACIEQGVKHATDLTTESEPTVRTDFRDVTLGIVSSDFHSATVEATEPLVGELAASVLDAGGQVVVAGIERFVPHRSDALGFAESEAVADDLSTAVGAYHDLPSRTPSLDRAVRCWSFEELATVWDGRSIDEVVAYGDRPSSDTGVAVLDSSARFEEAATALSAAGAQVIVHATAEGIPTGHPLTPVLKVTGDPATYDALSADIDLNAQRTTRPEAISTLRAVLDGEAPTVESHGITEFAISRVGPSV